MSHIVQVAIKMTDKESLLAACARLKLEVIPGETHKVYGQTFRGTAIRLPGWDYPVVVSEKGEAQYDNYRGNWGEQTHLDELCQVYSVEQASRLGLNQGYTPQEEQLDNGDIRLTLTAY